MSNRSGTAAGGLRDLILSVGLTEAVKQMPDLTDAESAKVDLLVSQRYGGSYAAALDVQDPALAAEIDALMRRNPSQAVNA